MIHLITVTGATGKLLYLDQAYIPDFKSVLRTVTSGRVMVISTKFRTDLFYSAPSSELEAILKLWALYAKVEETDLIRDDIIAFDGEEDSLTNYFQAINLLNNNWHRYTIYQRAFHRKFQYDPNNPVAQMIVECDQHLTSHPSIKRRPLIQLDTEKSTKVAGDTFSLAMKIINDDTAKN